MQATTLSFDNFHEYGSLFANMLRARHTTFIEGNKWELPQVDGMEYDQYDTPASRRIAIHELGHILASVRLSPTTARCGIYSYMIRDAQLGLLGAIPKTLLWDQAPVASHVWEGSRVFISQTVPSRQRLRVQMALTAEMVSSARRLGATSMLAIIPENSPRLVRRTGIECIPAGPVLEFDGSRSVCVKIQLAQKLH